jgi:NAD-dependent SIR2 family protein deacetylase
MTENSEGMLLIGAGASYSMGIPTMKVDWRYVPRKIFAGLKVREYD